MDQVQTQNKVVKIHNFNLNIFRQLLKETLMVNNQIMIEFGGEFIRSCALSPQKVFMKVWTIPTKSFIGSKDEVDENGVIDLDKETPQTDLSTLPIFNFYVLKGDLFRNYLSVHSTDLVDLEFTLEEGTDKRFQATTITITGKSENNNALVTKFTLTTEDLITSRVEDYGNLIRECTPSDDMYDIIIDNVQMQEIKRLIKNLHKSSIDNSSYLTFTIKDNKVQINDKVFNVNFPLKSSDVSKIESDGYTFNILKSDFIMAGEHTFNVYTNNDAQKVTFGTKFAGALIWCISTKITEGSALDNDADFGDIIDLDDIGNDYGL